MDCLRGLVLLPLFRRFSLLGLFQIFSSQKPGGGYKLLCLDLQSYMITVKRMASGCNFSNTSDQVVRFRSMALGSPLSY